MTARTPRAIDPQEAASLLWSGNKILILAHINPDGDTLGSAFALCRALAGAGKKARVECDDVLPSKYSFMWSGLEEETFDPEFTVCVDIAGEELLGRLKKYKIDLCIDHHKSNSIRADHTLIDDGAAATAEIVYGLLKLAGAEIIKEIADCLYTGVATDTGCFRYSNVTARTHRITAELLERGADGAEINRVMFDTKSRGYVELERMALDSLRMYYGGRCAVITITLDMLRQSGMDESGCEGISSLPRQIEGVMIGITVTQRADGSCKASVRTHEPIDASELCAALGGGGHARAAGCRVACGSVSEAVFKLLEEAGKYLS